MDVHVNLIDQRHDQMLKFWSFRVPVALANVANVLLQTSWTRYSRRLIF